jgi:hypothetical protein
MKKIFHIGLSFLIMALTAILPSALKAQETPEQEYTRVITQRADKIVNEMNFSSDELKLQIRNFIVDHYRFINDTDESRDKDIAAIREEFAANKELRDLKIDLRKYQHMEQIKINHHGFIAKLKARLSEEQIDQVKDGLTMGVLPLTYQAHLDMIPSLKEEEKVQIMTWLIEARENAISAGSSKEKHNWFGKYKGRINNYLSGRGYDLKAEREAWQERSR